MRKRIPAFASLKPGYRLLMIHGLSEEADVMKQHNPEHMMYRVMADDPARREGGKRDILAAIAGRPISAA